MAPTIMPAKDNQPVRPAVNAIEWGKHFISFHFHCPSFLFFSSHWPVTFPLSSSVLYTLWRVQYFQKPDSQHKSLHTNWRDQFSIFARNCELERQTKNIFLNFYGDKATSPNQTIQIVRTRPSYTTGSLNIVGQLISDIRFTNTRSNT